MKLDPDWRSATSYRVRIALYLKGVSFETVPLSFVTGEQTRAECAVVNLQRAVPTLVTDDGLVRTQSLAIMEYLDAIAPDRGLLHGDAPLRARMLASVLVLARDVHPISNQRVMNRLEEIGHSQQEGTDCMLHWMSEGLAAFQALIDPDGPFCFGESPSLAAICLIPQLHNVPCWGLDLSPFARLTDIEARCLALGRIETAHPEHQPDVH